MPRAILLDQISRQRRVPELYGIVLALPLNIPEENMGLMALISVPRAAGERLANSGGWAVMRADIILLFLRIERYANVHDAHLSLYALNRIFSQLPSPSLPLLSTFAQCVAYMSCASGILSGGMHASVQMVYL